MRGKVDFPAQIWAFDGITPAYAGKRTIEDRRKLEK